MARQGYRSGGRLATINHVEAGVPSPLRYIGIDAFESIAIEYEFGDERLHASIAAAEAQVDALVERLAATAPAKASDVHRALCPDAE